MKKTVAIVTVIVCILGVSWFFQGAVEAPTTEYNAPREEKLTFSSDTHGISFVYPGEYVLTEHAEDGERSLHTITLVHKSTSLPPEAGEGSPAITVQIFQNNLDKQTTEDWITQTSASNYKLGDGVLTPVSLGGESALRYSWDGLYLGQTIALSRPAWVYAFSVTMLSPGDQIRSDFEHIIESVRFQ